MTRLRTKGELIGVRLPLALDAVLRAEAAAARCSPGRYAGFVVAEALAAHQSGERPVTVQVAVDPGVLAVLARAGVLVPVPDPDDDDDMPTDPDDADALADLGLDPPSLQGVVAPPGWDVDAVETAAGEQPTLKVAPGVPCSHPRSVRHPDGRCGDCGWTTADDGYTWRRV